MKVQLNQFKELLPDLAWSAQELADKLSVIGFEAEAVGDGELNIALTANRHDCQDLKHLAFDLAGVYDLKTSSQLVSFQPGPLIEVTPDRINHLLGSQIDPGDLKKLGRLGFVVTEKGVQPPDFRDVATVADVAEEVVRMIGYNRLKIEPLETKEAPLSPEYNHLAAIKRQLAEAGLTETATSSFSDKGAVALKNPFSQDEPYLRSTLQPGLLQTLAKNPYLKRAVFFEIGAVFEPIETVKLGLIIAGYKNWSDWQAKIAAAIDSKVSFQPVNVLEAEKAGVKQNQLYWAEIPLEQIPTTEERPSHSSEPLAQFKPISKYPPLVREVTIEANPEGTSGSGYYHGLVSSAKTEFQDLLFVELADSYTNVSTSRQTETYRLIFQKMDSSFDQKDIHLIDDKIQKHFFG